MNRISVFYEHMAEAMKQENITLDEVCAAVKRDAIIKVDTEG